MNLEIEKAVRIAKRCLRKNYSRKGILAGTNHFDDLWARDAMFASLGALELGDYGVVKRSLENLLRNQRKDGLLPYRIGTLSSVAKIAGKKEGRKESLNYKDELGGSDVKDTNSLVVIIANEYVKKSGDVKFQKRYFERLMRAMKYYERGLVKEEPYGSWADSIPKKGFVLYTNILYWRALKVIEEICEEEGRMWRGEKSREVEKKIKEVFWNGGYFRDVSKGERFASDGNVLAMAFGFTGKEENKKIIGFVGKKKLEGFTLKASFPDYGESSEYHESIGIPDYHSLMWLWYGCLYGLFDKKMLKRISRKIIEYNMVYEIYERDGKPVNREKYQAEENFAWSSGVFIWAVKKAGL